MISIYLEFPWRWSDDLNIFGSFWHPQTAPEYLTCQKHVKNMSKTRDVKNSGVFHGTLIKMPPKKFRQAMCGPCNVWVHFTNIEMPCTPWPVQCTRARDSLCTMKKVWVVLRSTIIWTCIFSFMTNNVIDMLASDQAYPHFKSITCNLS